MKPFMWTDSSDSTKHFVGGAQRLANHHLIPGRIVSRVHGRSTERTTTLVTTRRDEADLGELGTACRAASGSTATAASEHHVLDATRCAVAGQRKLESWAEVPRAPESLQVSAGEAARGAQKPPNGGEEHSGTMTANPTCHFCGRGLVEANPEKRFAALGTC